MNFRYVGGGRAVANVLHHEALDIDLSQAFDPYEVHDDGRVTEPFEIAGDVFKWVRVR